MLAPTSPVRLFYGPDPQVRFRGGSFDYFVERTELCCLSYSLATIKKRRMELGFPSRNPLKELIRHLIND